MTTASHDDFTKAVRDIFGQFASPNRVEELRRRLAGPLDYQKIAAEQGTKIIRLMLALKVARAFGVHSMAFSASVSYELGKWIDAGADKPVPYFDNPFFNDWAIENGLSNCDGALGYKLTVTLAPAATAASGD